MDEKNCWNLVSKSKRLKVNIKIFSQIDVTKDSFGLSQKTAMNQSNGECGMECIEHPETLRGPECVECS